MAYDILVGKDRPHTEAFHKLIHDPSAVVLLTEYSSDIRNQGNSSARLTPIENIRQAARSLAHQIDNRACSLHGRYRSRILNYSIPIDITLAEASIILLIHYEPEHHSFEFALYIIYIMTCVSARTKLSDTSPHISATMPSTPPHRAKIRRAFSSVIVIPCRPGRRRSS
jgi:hypothetical protein